MQFIAEVKTQSPFGYQAERSWDELFRVANNIGDVIAIHTDPRWGGSFDLLEKARALTDKQILAKGVHAADEEICRAVEIGADLALVVGRLPGVHLERCLVEPNSLEELVELDRGIKAVWNSRDLAAGGLKAATFQEAREVFPGWLCQASNIRQLSDIEPLADAVLVGTHLEALSDEIKAK